MSISLLSCTIALAMAPMAMAQNATLANGSATYTEPCAQVSAQASSPKAIIRPDTMTECLMSVPVDVEGDLQLMNDYTEYIAWQSTMAYLKNPPKDYLYPPVDIIAGIQNLTNALKADQYQSEYAFQQDLAGLIDAARDGHFVWFPDIFAVVAYNRPAALALTSVSLDGVSLPEVFLYEDILLMSTTQGFVPSPLAFVDNLDINTFMAEAALLNNNQDPDANFNSVLFNQAVTAGSGTSYVPAGSFTLVLGQLLGPQTDLFFANGTNASVANYVEVVTDQDFSGVVDGKSFFDKFCSATSSNSSSAAASSTVAATTTPAATSSASPTASLYPSPVALMPELGVGGWFLQGEGFDDTAVLSIFSFMDGATLSVFQSYSDTITQFLSAAQAAGKQRLIVDLRGNPGGEPPLALDAFAQLFPDVASYVGERYHANDALNEIGDLFSGYFQANPPNDTTYPLYGVLAYEAFLNQDGDHFSSWTDFYGPQEIYGDTFTSLSRDDPDDRFAQTDFVIYGTGNRTLRSRTPPFASENIVMLYDGICASTCTVFSELMKSQGKVQSVAIGGRPGYGPMQGVGGVKGSQVIFLSGINEYAQVAIELAGNLTTYANTAVSALANATHILQRAYKSAEGATSAGINTRNNYRMNDTTQTPLQFVYEAADCRLFYTPAMIADVTNTWKAVAEVTWGLGRNSTSNSSRVQCVQGSTKGLGSLSSGNITIPYPSVSQTPRNNSSNGTSSPSSQPSAQPSPYVPTTNAGAIDQPATMSRVIAVLLGALFMSIFM